MTPSTKRSSGVEAGSSGVITTRSGIARSSSTTTSASSATPTGRGGRHGRSRTAARTSIGTSRAPIRQRQRVEGAEARDGQERREQKHRRRRPERRGELGQPRRVPRRRARGRPPQERGCPRCPEHQHAEQRRLSAAAGDDGRQSHGEDARGQSRGKQRGHRWEGTPVRSARDGVRQPGHRDERGRQDHEEGRAGRARSRRPAAGSCQALGIGTGSTAAITIAITAAKQAHASVTVSTRVARNGARTGARAA